MGKKINSDLTTEPGDTTENDTSTESTKKGRGRPRKEPGPGGEAGRTETETILPKLVLVDVPDQEEPEILEAPKKKPTTAAKKKPKRDQQLELKKDQLAVLIKTVFDIMGTRPGFEIWKLSLEESILIAEPLSNILNKNTMVDKITSEYGDYIALIVAIGTIIIPRAMVQIKSKPKKEEKVKYDKQITDRSSTGNEIGTDGTRIKQDDRVVTDDRENFGNKLFDVIPSII